MVKKNLGSSRVQCNLIQQNCFVRDCSLKQDLMSDEVPYTYSSLVEKTVDDGIKHEFEEFPYEITPQYVNSFCSSSDYRRDPFAAILNGKGGANLGDVRSLQDINEMDTSALRSLYEELSAKFAPIKVSSPEVEAPAPEAPAPVVDK